MQRHRGSVHEKPKYVYLYNKELTREDSLLNIRKTIHDIVRQQKV